MTYREMAQEIINAYPIDFEYHGMQVNNPLDMSFMIEVDINGIETPDSVDRNIRQLRIFEKKRIHLSKKTI